MSAELIVREKLRNAGVGAWGARRGFSLSASVPRCQASDILTRPVLKRGRRSGTQGPDDTNGEMAPEGVDFNLPPATTGRSVNNEALGSKEVLGDFRRMKPGGLRRGVHPGLPPTPPSGRPRIAQPQVQTTRALSVRGRRFPLPCPPCCGGVCVPRG